MEVKLIKSLHNVDREQRHNTKLPHRRPSSGTNLLVSRAGELEMMTTTYFGAGASRGIGLELTRKLASLSATDHVFAGVRNPSVASGEVFRSTKVTWFKLDVLSENDVNLAAKTIARATNGKLDTLIVNAGINIIDKIVDTSVQELRTTPETNTVAVHRLVQTCLPLLRRGASKKVVILGAASGTFSTANHLASHGMPAVGAYAVSKAATHMLNMLYGAELAKDGILSLSVHPGVVMTGMAEQVMQSHPDIKEMTKQSGMKAITPAESAEGIVRVVEDLSSETSGKLMSWEGHVVPY